MLAAVQQKSARDFNTTQLVTFMAVEHVNRLLIFLLKLTFLLKPFKGEWL